MSATKLPARYACVLIDEAFKLTICNPEHELLLRKIIELLIPGKKIRELHFADKEQHGLVISDKNTTFDLYCTEEDSGEQFIVEVQVAPQVSYRERMLSYATYPIHKQLATKLQRIRNGEDIQRMDYSLKPVYVVSIVNFSLPHESDDALEEGGLISRYEIRNGANGERMTDALSFVFLELGRLRWKLDEADRCETLLEQFAHAMKYMHLQEKPPQAFRDPLLGLLYQAAEMAQMTLEERTKLDMLMTTQLDINGYINYAEKKGREEGFAEGCAEGHAKGKAEGREEGLQEKELEIARRMVRELGFTVEQATRVTGLSPEQVRGLM